MNTLPAFVPPVVQWLLHVTTIGMLGVAAFYWAVLRPLEGERGFALLAFPALRRAWALGWALTTLGLVLLPLRFGVRAIELFGADAMTRSRGMILTGWGIGWWLEHAAVVLFGVGLHTAGAEGRRPGWILVGVGALIGALVPPLAGHAAAENPIGGWALLNDVVHVGAAGAWLGGLGLVLAVGLPAALEADVPRELAGGLSPPALVLARFSRLALISAGLLALTGVISARIHVQSWGALVATDYGRVLLVKLALVLPAALLGLYHWRRVLPRIDDGDQAERLRRTAGGELGLGLAVLAVTAVLALTPTPGASAGMEQSAPSAVPARP
jgi:putative copper export protein